MQFLHSPLALLAIMISVTGAYGAFQCPVRNRSQALCLKDDADQQNPTVIVVKPNPIGGSYYECPSAQGAQDPKCCLTGYKIKYLSPGQSVEVTVKSFHDNCKSPTQKDTN